MTEEDSVPWDGLCVQPSEGQCLKAPFGFLADLEPWLLMGSGTLAGPSTRTSFLASMEVILGLRNLHYSQRLEMLIDNTSVNRKLIWEKRLEKEIDIGIWNHYCEEGNLKILESYLESYLDYLMQSPKYTRWRLLWSLIEWLVIRHLSCIEMKRWHQRLQMRSFEEANVLQMHRVSLMRTVMILNRLFSTWTYVEYTL